MTREQFAKLETGDLVRHKLDHKAAIVSANYGGRVTAVRTLDMTNPDEWVLVSKADHAAKLEAAASELSPTDLATAMASIGVKGDAQ